MTEIEELTEILRKPDLTEQDWKKFYELRQQLVDKEICKQLDNLVEVRYIGD
jgi:hypothetical protein